MKPKVLICEYCQESNSFSPLVWDIDRFQSLAFCGGLKMRVMFKIFKSPVRGMVEAVKKHGGTPVYGFAMRAMSGGPVSDRSVEVFLEKTFATIEKSGPFDGILLSLHGATISESEEDACGYIVEAVRKKVGASVKIGLACDLHANVTRKMEVGADFICGFQTYPHIDMYETGYRAGNLVMEQLSGKKRKQVYFRMPMMVPASGYTTETGRFHGIMEEGFRLVEKGVARDFTIFMMQPWLDVKEAASCVTLVCDEGAAEAGLQQAERIGKLVYDSREEFWPEPADLKRVKEVVLARHAQAADCSGNLQGWPKGPVVLAEPADSPNAGAVGDSVELLAEILKWGEGICAVTMVMDPAAVKLARQTGQGNTAVFHLGAGYTPGMEGPVTLNCQVVSLHKGKFRMAGPAGKGLPLDIGPAAVLRAGSIDILVCERPGGTGDVNFYRGFGINWENYDLMVVKANTSFRECYKNIASQIFVADTYGAASADFTRLPFERIDKEHFYPFNREA